MRVCSVPIHCVVALMCSMKKIITINSIDVVSIFAFEFELPAGDTQG